MCRLLETIKISNGKGINLRYHQQRMDEAYRELYGRANPFDLETIIRPAAKDSFGVVKCRVTYSSDDYTITFEKYQPRPIRSLKMVHDNSIDYHLKYADRSAINHLLEKKEKCDDILIIKNDLVTDISFANIAFFDGKNWVTPDTPLLNGTKRQLLIDRKIIHTQNIHPNDLKKFSGFRIINAMLDFDGQKIIPVDNIIDSNRNNTPANDL